MEINALAMQCGLNYRFPINSNGHVPTVCNCSQTARYLKLILNFDNSLMRNLGQQTVCHSGFKAVEYSRL